MVGVNFKLIPMNKTKKKQTNKQTNKQKQKTKQIHQFSPEVHFANGAEQSAQQTQGRKLLLWAGNFSNLQARLTV